MVKIVMDAGHGLPTPGKRSPDGEKEWDFNNQVVLACIAKLQSYGGVDVLRVDDPTGRRDVPLRERTDRANRWQADVYVAVHHNANSGTWGDWSGVETYTYDHPQANPKSVDLARLVHPRIVRAMGLADRGLKRANLHVLRETAMPAILTEGGFMDSTIDILALRSAARLQAQGEAIAEGLAAYFDFREKKGGKGEGELPDSYEKDAPPSEWLAQEFQEAVDLGITNGTYPRRPATREEVAVMIVRAMRRLKEEWSSGNTPG
ncbi:N-acetylmuramoyl-L-alanine amidase [Bacillus sp. OxB-1]|uniref:N-acetylmuramoyl-L-alanine amidase family protein n=1 Tax=Bacillus sp. (strain OxB-1) TaxID=98228 RepID=UPI0005820AA1|nr:N-acetylmuramoyl-L-alanine amidase [Bacillus sp. OxB-1]BAQ10650.1 N-acetylmuramoyl-L-alanine amidase [Bacillus sp. OxB-1]